MRKRYVNDPDLMPRLQRARAMLLNIVIDRPLGLPILDRIEAEIKDLERAQAKFPLAKSCLSAGRTVTVSASAR